MTMHFSGTTPEMEAAMLQSRIKWPTLEDGALYPCLGAPDPEAAARRKAELMAGAANAAVQTTAEEKRRAIARRVAEIMEERLPIRQGLRACAGLKLKRRRRADRDFAPTLGERLNRVYLLVLRLGAVGMAAAVTAAFIQGSSYSIALSEDGWKALAYAFPIVIASTALASRADFTDDVAAKRRIGRRLIGLGAAAFALWVVLTGLLFGPAGDGGLDFGSVLATPPSTGAAGWIEAAREIAGMLFPQTAQGKALLALHILSDTLLAAGLGVKGALLATQGREEVWEPRGDRDAWRALDVPAREELARLEAEDGRYAAIVAEVSAIAEALRADAVARLPVLRRRRDAHLAQAEVDFVQAL